MKNLFLVILVLLGACSSELKNDGFLMFANFGEKDQFELVFDNQISEISKSLFNHLRVEDVDLSLYPKVRSEQMKNQLFSIIAEVCWTLDSIGNIDETSNKSNWLWQTKQWLINNTDLHIIGEVRLSDHFNSFVVVSNCESERHTELDLYVINTINSQAVSIAQIGRFNQSDRGVCLEYVTFDEKRDIYELYSKLTSYHHNQMSTTETKTEFHISASGRIIWKQRGE